MSFIQAIIDFFDSTSNETCGTCSQAYELTTSKCKRWLNDDCLGHMREGCDVHKELHCGRDSTLTDASRKACSRWARRHYK